MALADRMITLRLRVLSFAYPSLHPLRVHVYDSSGFAQAYRKGKVSLHISLRPSLSLSPLATHNDPSTLPTTVTSTYYKPTAISTKT